MRPLTPKKPMPTRLMPFEAEASVADEPEARGRRDRRGQRSDLTDDAATVDARLGDLDKVDEANVIIKEAEANDSNEAIESDKADDADEVNEAIALDEAIVPVKLD
jgi:hypothetical protein